MREAQITLPQFANHHGASLKPVRAMIVRRLTAAFGGCTVRKAQGSWRNAKGYVVAEPVWEIVVACEDTPANAHALFTIADEAGVLANQEAMYIRLPSGDVEIIDVARHARRVAA